MTRFARARGSKACNERQEEEATPWCVMRQQLTNQEDQFKHPDLPSAPLEKQPKLIKSNNEFEEHWSKFGEPFQKETIGTVNNALNKMQKTKNIKTKKLNKIVKDNALGFQKKKAHIIDSTSQENLTHLKNNVCHEGNELATKKKQLKKSIKVKLGNELPNLTIRVKKTKSSATSTNNSIDTNCKSIIRNIASSNILTEETQDTYITNKTKKSEDIKSKNSHGTKSKKLQSHSKFGKPVYNKNFTSNHNNKDEHTIISNGREIQIVRYDGFFVKKEDAIELKKLRKKLKAQNIPAEKIKTVLKLERRKAEKALARDKKAVCFQCRQFGHNFADCPEIKDSDVSKSGMCFKCGSMEHTHFECKISQNQSFRFAVCFVCKEQGHIARQCPVNPKGQYPKGGACHLCGDNTHLRMNCPKAPVENQTQSLTLPTNKIGSNLEDISDQNIVQKTKASKKKKKIVTF